MTRVSPIKEMTDELFAKHWNYRHHRIDLPKSHSLLGEGKSDNRPAVIAAFRAFHDTMHRLNPRKYDHEHF